MKSSAAPCCASNIISIFSFATYSFVSEYIPSSSSLQILASNRVKLFTEANIQMKMFCSLACSSLFVMLLDGTWLSLCLMAVRLAFQHWSSILMCLAYAQATKWFRACRPEFGVHMWNPVSVTVCQNMDADIVACNCMHICVQPSLHAFIQTWFDYIHVFLHSFASDLPTVITAAS